MLVLSGLNANWNYIHAGASGSFLTGTRTRRAERGRDPRRRLDRPAAGAGSSATRRSSPRSSCRMDAPAERRRLHRQPELRLHAHDLLAQRRRSRCRWSTTRARCSSGCSATAAAPSAGARAARLRQQQEHPRFGDGQAGRTEAGARRRRTSAKVDEYTEAVRDVERRIQRAEEQSDIELPTLEQPQGVPPVFEDHLALMLDLQVLALQSRSDARHHVHDRQGAERAAVPADRRARRAPSAVAPQQRSRADRAACRRSTAITPQLFAKYLAKLRATPDGDGSLLDHMTILYGAGISNSNAHSGDNLPLLLVGGGAGRLQGRPASQVRRQAADGEPAGHADGQARRAGRADRRQHRASCRSTRCRAC